MAYAGAGFLRREGTVIDAGSGRLPRPDTQSTQRLRAAIADCLPGVAVGCVGLLLCLCNGCGGGATISSAQVSTPPSPAPDFSLQLSSSSLALSQGGAGSVSVSITAQNGFNGVVQVALSGLPSGVTSNPTSPFTVAAGGNTAVVLGAAIGAATGNFTVTAAGSSGSLSHSATLQLTVNASVASALPRTAYARTDALLAMDDPPGEPRHRRIAYDLANKHVFVANHAMNRVEVFSTTNQTRVAQISIPGASSADLSADGATVWAGTSTEQAFAIDAASLQVRGRYAIPALVPAPNSVFDRPEELQAMSNGKLMMRLRQSASPQALLALWDPLANAVTNLTSVAPALFQNGLGAIAHTGDGSRLLVAANDSSGELAVLDGTGGVVVAPRVLGAGTIPLVAANLDGSRFAVEFISGSTAQVLLLDGTLNQAATPVSLAAQGLAFSRDGKFLYVSQNSGGMPAISVFDGSSLALLGQAPDAAVQSVHSDIEEADETHLLFGVCNRGLAFVDASSPVALPATVPAFASAPVAQPSEGPAAGGTTTQLAGQNFESTAQLKFGSQLSANVSVTVATQIQAVTPPSVTNDAVNISAYFPSGWLALAADAFSYEPQILKVLPNAGSKSGGDVVQLYGYGFGLNAAGITVKIGGATAIVQKVENVSSIAASLGLDASYPFPIERITLQTPAGNPGPADVLVTSPAGSATFANAFQYLQSEHVFAKAALYKFVLYDQKRQWLYLSSTDHVDVFDLAGAQFHSMPLTPAGGPPPNAAMRGLSLTPDGTQLVVADFGAQKIYLLNPDTGSGTIVPVGGVAGFTNSGPARVAATSAQTVFVGMSGEGGSTGPCSPCLSQLNLAVAPPTIQPAPQPQVTTLTGMPLVQANGTGDHVFLAYAVTSGPVGIWSAASPNQFTTSVATESAIDLATAADGTSFATRVAAGSEIRGGDLVLSGTPTSPELEQIPGRVLVPGATMHPSGALLYQPFLNGPPPAAPPASGIQGGVDIIDTHSGRLRLRIFLPEALAMLSSDTDARHGSFLTIDENGQRIFALTASGLTIVQLAAVPLGIGTTSPSAGPAAGGATLTIRGSGFQNGATVIIGGKSAPATFIDMNTLSVTAPVLTAGPQQVVITNPDGESATLDAAFTAN